MAPTPGTLITVAPTGAELAKADFPQLPTTLEELVETAKSCEAAGASMIHLHIRDADHRPTLDHALLKAAVDALREQTSLVIQLSTGGSVHDPLDQRLTVLDAEPDSCSLTCGTTNFGDDVFLNPWGFMSDLYVQAREREVVPEFELFDLGHVASLARLLDKHGLPFGGQVHVDFVTGVPPGRRRRARRGGPPAGRHGGQRRLCPGGAGRAQRPAGRAGRPPGRPPAAPPDVDRRRPSPARRQGPPLTSGRPLPPPVATRSSRVSDC